MIKRILAVLLSLMLLMPCALAEAVSCTEESSIFDGFPGSLEHLVQMIAGGLARQEYTLDIRNAYGAHSISVGSSDGETIRAQVHEDGRQPFSIQIDADGNVSCLEEGETYTLPEIADLLLFGDTGEGFVDQLLTMVDGLTAEELDFIRSFGETAYYELMNAGVIPVEQYVNGDMHMSVNITPDLIMAAGVRLAENLLQNPEMVNALLARIDPLLRMLVPELFEEYDPETGLITEREGYTCAELQTLFDSWMSRHWLDGWLDFEGMNLNMRLFAGDDGWSADAGFFMPGSDISVWLMLNGDENGSFEGTLEYCSVGYSRISERREMQALRFNISGALTDVGASLRVRPETPMRGFTGLQISCTAGYSDLVIQVLTDILNIRAAITENLLDISAVTEDILLDVHMNCFDGVPRGNVMYRNYRDGFYLKLNETEKQAEETPAATPEPTIKPSVGKPEISIGSPVYQDGGVTYIKDDIIIFRWMADGDVESYTVDLVYEDGTTYSLGSTTHISKTLHASQLSPGLYKLYVSAMPVGGSAEDAMQSEIQFGIPAPESPGVSSSEPEEVQDA